MNANITTLRRLRSAHNKYARLVQDNKDGGELVESQVSISGATQSQGSVESIVTFDSETTTLVDAPMGRKRARERAWRVHGEVDGQGARECLHWMCSIVLEHDTFQGEQNCE
jgi:hypothetical protein